MIEYINDKSGCHKAWRLDLVKLMIRKLWESPVGRMGIFLCLACCIFHPLLLPAQESQPTYETQLEIDELKERVRSLYAQEQYEQALQELDRLEQISPNEPAVEFYRGLAERRLREGARSAPTPSPSTSPTPAIESEPQLPPAPPPSDGTLNPGDTTAPRPGTGEVEVPARPSRSRSNFGLIIAAVIGVILIVVLIVAILALLKRSKKAHVPPVGAMTPTQSPAPPAPPYQSPLQTGPSSPNPYDSPAGGVGGAAIGDSFFNDNLFKDSQSEASPVPSVQKPIPPSRQPVELSSSDFEELPSSSAPPPVPSTGAGRPHGAPSLFGSGTQMGGDPDSGKIPAANQTLFSGPEPANSGANDFHGLSSIPAPESPMDFPFEDSTPQAPASPPARPKSLPTPPIPAPPTDMSSISFDLGMSFEDEPQAKEQPEPQAPAANKPAASQEISFDDLGFGEFGLNLDEPAPAKQPVKPAAPDPPKPAIPPAAKSSSAEGISLDDFIFSGDVQTNVPGVSAPQSIPKMAGESQFPEPADSEPTSAAEDMMFSGIDQTAFPGGNDATVAGGFGSIGIEANDNKKQPEPQISFPDISEDQTMDGREDKPSYTISPTAAFSIDAAPKKSQPDKEDNANFINDGGIQTPVSEQTRILSPRDYGVTRSKESERQALPAAPAKPAASDEDKSHPRKAGPMDQTTFLGNVAEKMQAGSGSDGDDSKVRTSESLFDKHFAQGNEAFDNGDWKEAIYHLNVAYTLKPNSQEVRDKLREARRHRKEARSES